MEWSGCWSGKATADLPGYPFAVAIGEAGLAIAVVDGSCGWGRGHEAGRAAVGPITRRLLTGRDPFSVRLADAMNEANRLAGTFAGPLTDGDPAFSVVAALISPAPAGGAIAEVGWLGDCSAVLVRATAVVGRNRRHLLLEEMLDAGIEPTKHSRIIPRAVPGGGPDPLKPDQTRWELAPGDRLIFACGTLDQVLELTRWPPQVVGLTAEAAARALVALPRPQRLECFELTAVVVDV